jgi:soluble lytic murein transglycosylase-like protein
MNLANALRLPYIVIFCLYAGLLANSILGTQQVLNSKKMHGSKKRAFNVSFLFPNIPWRYKKPNAQEVYEHIVKTCETYNIDPAFVYAIAMAESSLNPTAKTNVARGMMQLTEDAWNAVSNKHYSHAWDWKTNIEAGIAYLDFCKKILVRHGQFNHANLAAAYHYGPNALKNKQFDVSALKPSKNAVYKKLFTGCSPEMACEIPVLIN